MNNDCLFCKIAAKKISANILYSDEEILAFEDISPQAPVHVLIIPRKHISTLNDLTGDDQNLVGRIFIQGKNLAKKMGCDEAGYRIVVNCNKAAGQEVFHLHAHLLGGRAFSWPPG